MIALRDLRPEDKEMIRSWRNLPEVAEQMYTSHTIGPEEHERWFRSIEGDPKRAYWVVTHAGRDVGLANLYDIDPAHRRCSWAFYIADKAARARGLGSFLEYRLLQHVFGEHGFRKLSCEVLTTNQSVLEMHKRFGFREEGRYREHVLKDGRPVDVVALAILRPEWESARPAIEKQLEEIKERLRSRGYLAGDGERAEEETVGC